MAFETVEQIPSNDLEEVPADENIRDVVEQMLSEGYSQLGVKKNGSLIGAISYRSIARALLTTEDLFDSPDNLGSRTAELAVEEPRIINAEAEVSELFQILGERAYVLVEANEDYEIITDYDIREFWRESTEPFLLIEEVEYAIRAVIREVYADSLSETLQTFTAKRDDLRTIERVEQCSFSHYERLFSVNWDDGFDEIFYEQRDFVRELTNRLGEHRNQLFHFRIDDRSEFDIDLIEFAHGYFTAIGDPYLE